MYIDPSDPSRTMEQEVNEATAALKGLLGIGSSAPQVSSSDRKDVSPNTPTGEHETMDNSRGGNKKRYKKKNQQQQQQQQTHYHQNRNTRNTGGGRHNNSYNRDYQQRDHRHNSNSNPPLSANKKNNRKNKNKKDNAARSVNAPQTSQNFAWSAFQSSPDASKLPTPDFVSPSNEKEVVSVPDSFSVLLTAASSGDYVDTTANSNSSMNGPSAIIIENATRAEDLEDRVIAEAKKHQAEAEAAAAAAEKAADPAADDEHEAEAASNVVSYVSPSSTPVLANAASPSAEASAEKAANVVGADANTAKISEMEAPSASQPTSATKTRKESSLSPPPTAERHSAVPVSKTGINLAALAGTNTTATTTSTNNAPTARQQHQQQHIQLQQQQQQLAAHHQQQQQQYQLHAANAAYSAPQYAPPPHGGYVTIQVQVPMVLMPGRQMVVTSPSGYPVRVVVPEGIPPGMVIPVHVPAGPPQMHPQHHPGLMPPSAGSYGNYYHHPR